MNHINMADLVPSSLSSRNSCTIATQTSLRSALRSSASPILHSKLRFLAPTILFEVGVEKAADAFLLREGV